MARYIDADALDEKLDALMKRYAAQGRKQVAEDYNFVRTVLLTAPTIEVRPVVRGEWTKGAIISGYQGIGKSTLAKNASGYIDLESGNFWVDGSRADDWYKPYCQIAVHLAKQGYRVFISSHAVVREYLAGFPREVKLYVCFPSYSLKSAWVKKLEHRFLNSNLEKDYKAWQNALDRFDENIKELHTAKGFAPIIIHDMNYCLERVIDANCGADMRRMEDDNAD